MFIFIWLPGSPERQNSLHNLYTSLCRDKGKLVAFLKEPYDPIPVEPKLKKEKKIPKDRKRFSREDARKLLESGSSYTEIGNAYGVSRSAVWKALRQC